MKISLIVAASANNVIGRDGGLPWHLPDDLRRFRLLTLGKPVIMGRLTHESIGRALPGRRNIVLSSDPLFRSGDCLIAATVDEALELAGADEVMVIGGAYVYRQFLPLADRIYLTRVEAIVDGDAFFPDLDPDEWAVSSREDFEAGDEHGHACSFQILDRLPES